MSRSGELFAVREEMTARPSFELVLRGYDKRQVDQYVSQAHGDISTLAAERERTLGQIHDLTGQLKRLQVEVTELRQRPAQVDRASFRDLGPMVDEILALAEKQAAAIMGSAAQRAADREAEAEKVLVQAREQAAQKVRDLQVELAARRTAEERAHGERRTAAQAELTEIRESAEKQRADGEAACERAEQEANRIKEQSVQHVERVRAESEAMQEAARAQAQQERTQWQADMEREIGERRTEAAKKIAALHAQAQQHSDEVRRRSDEQAAAHQRQLAIVQHEIQVRQEALAQMQTELDTAQQRLGQSRQEEATANHEVAQLQQRLGEVRQDLTAELNRLDEARRAVDTAERRATEIRARVQREAKRVANLAAAAVMAAAAGGGDTGEYPKVITVRSGGARTADEATAPPGGDVAPDREPPTSDNGHASHDRVSHDTDIAVPAQRGPQPEAVASDTE